jgi:hypothetical protein
VGVTDHLVCCFVIEQQLRAKYKQWASGVRAFAATYVYRVLQFVSEPADVEYGSELQKSTCDHLGVPAEYRADFWAEEGCRSLEESIRRKRGTLYNGLHLAFKRYCEKPERDENGVAIPPPDPTEFIPSEMYNGERSLGGSCL